jgi:4,5-DOPA dioxygenase extradiol
MPAVFVGHGSPMNAIEDNAFRRSWIALGARLPRPKAILCVSAHWETRGVALTASETPGTIHDFLGFPRALFDVRYPAPGDPALARRAAALLASAGAHLDPERGLDHGAWAVLLAMYPRADVPVVQLSLDSSREAAFHYRLGQALLPLRNEGVLIVGSGNIVHNLMRLDLDETRPLDWAGRFDAEIRRRILAREHGDLIDFERLRPDARLAVPTPEHYLPLLYAVALHQVGEPLSLFNTMVLSSLSMTSVLIGLEGGVRGAAGDRSSDAP